MRALAVRALPAPLCAAVAVVGAVVAAALALVTPAAHADIPAASREFRTERYVVSEMDLEALRERRFFIGALSGGIFQQSEGGGEWNPFGSWKQIGGERAEVGATFGRFTVAADGVADTRRRVEGDEFEQRIRGTVYVPEARLSVSAAAGFESGYDGADVTLESLLMRPAVPSETMDLRPRIWAWLRLRKYQDLDDPVLRPAIGAFIQHAIVVGSQAYAGLTLWTDVSDKVLPRSSAMLQLGFGTVPRPLWGPENPGPMDPAPPPVFRNLFGTVAYVAPLDDRARARFVAQVGIRLVTI